MGAVVRQGGAMLRLAATLRKLETSLHYPMGIEKGQRFSRNGEKEDPKILSKSTVDFMQ